MKYSNSAKLFGLKIKPEKCNFKKKNISLYNIPTIKFYIRKETLLVPARSLFFLCTFFLHSPLIRPNTHGFWQGATAVDDDLASCEVASFVAS